MSRTSSVVVLALATVACGSADLSSLQDARSGERTFEVDGNPDCADLGYGGIDVKIDPPTSGTYEIVPGYFVDVTVSPDGQTWSFDSDLSVDAAITKGGDAALVTEYDPEAFSDGGLVAPINGSGSNAALSHMNLCIDFEVEVDVVIETSLDRTWSWAIDKSAETTDLLLSDGQTYLMPYTVELSTTGSTDSNHAMSATVEISNPAPFDAEITAVNGDLDGVAVAIDCGPLPIVLGAGLSGVCAVDADLPDDSDFELAVSVTTSGTVGGNSAVVIGDFADAIVEDVDDCVDVDDDPYGFLGQVCIGDSDMTFEYTMDIVADSCASFDVPNVASFLTNDTGAVGEDSWSVHVDVGCDTNGGCSLTPGYWKTHSEHGPAPYDDTWAQLASGADTDFFLSGQSWYDAMWTPVAGDAYYILARAYAAAYLNGLNGADTTGITSELADAEAILAVALPGTLRGPDRRDAIAVAAILDDYNNGLIGPGHCDE